MYCDMVGCWNWNYRGRPWMKHMRKIMKVQGGVILTKEHRERQVIGKIGELLQTNLRIEHEEEVWRCIYRFFFTAKSIVTILWKDLRIDRNDSITNIRVLTLVSISGCLNLNVHRSIFSFLILSLLSTSIQWSIISSAGSMSPSIVIGVPHSPSSISNSWSLVFSWKKTDSIIYLFS